MSVQEYTCPSCGASLKVENRFSKVLVCQYCGQTCSISPGKLDPTGEKSKLAEFPSLFSIGASGTFNGQRFKTLGRLRYQYDGGFWDEWFVTLESGKKLWIQEDEGELTSFEKESLTSAIPPFSDISVGSIITVNNKSVFVTEKNEAWIEGGQGELYFTVKPGMAVFCCDGNAEGQLTSIEWTPEEITLSIGEEIPLSSIVFD